MGTLTLGEKWRNEVSSVSHEHNLPRVWRPSLKWDTETKDHFRGDSIFRSIFVKLSQVSTKTKNRSGRWWDSTLDPNLETTPGYPRHKSIHPTQKDPSALGTPKPSLPSFHRAWHTQQHAFADQSLNLYQCPGYDPHSSQWKAHHRFNPGSRLRWASSGSFETADTSRAARNTARPVETVAKSARLLYFRRATDLIPTPPSSLLRSSYENNCDSPSAEKTKSFSILWPSWRTMVGLSKS